MNVPQAQTKTSRRGRVKLRLVHLESGQATESGSADNWLLITLLASAFVLLGAFVMRFIHVS